MPYCTIKDALLVEKERQFYPPCLMYQRHRIWPFDLRFLTVGVVRLHMPQLRIQYRIQAVCGCGAEKEGVATAENGIVTTKSENASVVIVDAENESGNVVMFENENEKGNENVVMVENENEKRSAVGEKGSIVTKKENALKENVSIVKCPE